jgi:hypothetical protein
MFVAIGGVMAKVFVCGVEAEMRSLLDQLAELNGCPLEDEFREMLGWPADDGEDDEGDPLPLAAGKAFAS